MRPLARRSVHELRFSSLKKQLSAPANRPGELLARARAAKQLVEEGIFRDAPEELRQTLADLVVKGWRLRFVDAELHHRNIRLWINVAQHRPAAVIQPPSLVAPYRQWGKELLHASSKVGIAIACHARAMWARWRFSP